MPELPRKLKVFLCHASQDKPVVRELCQRLAGEGWIDPWLDAKKLLPGQDWREEIEIAVDAADSVIIFLSGASINKEGFVQKEMRYAKEMALEKPEGSIFLIPVRLEACEAPRGLRFFQWVDYFGEKKEQSYGDLLESLKIRLEEKMRKEAAEKAKRAAEEYAQKKAAEELARKAAQEKARAEAEEKLRLEAEERAWQELKEKIEREAREKVRLEMDERLRLEAEARVRSERKLKVFLCHATQDKPVVRELYRRLALESWIDPWLDEEKLLPGHDWDMEIEKAVEAADVVIVCLSNNSVTKEGYVQRELRFALDIALTKPEETIFIIPLRLEECQPPRRLRGWQYADYFPPERHDWAYGRLRKSLELRAEAMEIATAPQPAAEPARPIQRAKPTTPAAPPDRLTLSNGMEFCRVPAGSFLMGSAADDKNAYDDEKPQHQVETPYDYWMARFPVTNANYAEYVSAIGAKHPSNEWQKKKDHPVVYVSWKDAIAYCQWLNNVLRGQLPGNYMLRLPSEAEWEKAACWKSFPLHWIGKGESLEFPWGNDFVPNKCNTREGGKGDTTPVRLYSPQGDSPYGCANMSGNVWEWTHSLWKAYPCQANDGREDEKSLSARVLRGGSYVDLAWSARCACRLVCAINYFHYDVGFRVALAPPFS